MTAEHSGFGAGQLGVVATPIGNLGDITARAVQCLREADGVLAEDTRRARALLSHLGIESKPVERLDAHAERGELGRFVERMAAGHRLALLTDAGTPGVSDPGAALVRACVAAGVPVTPLPGPSAVLAALAASGFGSTGFRFFGFLPRSGKTRRVALERLCRTEETAVLFESTARLVATLAELSKLMPNRELCIARELTKVHEELLRGSVAELELASRERTFKGEVTLVLGPHEAAEQAPAHGDDWLDARVDELLGQGLRPKDVARTLGLETALPVAELYRRVCLRQRQR